MESPFNVVGELIDRFAAMYPDYIERDVYNFDDYIAEIRSIFAKDKEGVAIEFYTKYAEENKSVWQRVINANKIGINDLAIIGKTLASVMFISNFIIRNLKELPKGTIGFDLSRKKPNIWVTREYYTKEFDKANPDNKTPGYYLEFLHSQRISSKLITALIYDLTRGTKEEKEEAENIDLNAILFGLALSHVKFMSDEYERLHWIPRTEKEALKRIEVSRTLRLVNLDDIIELGFALH